jgi:hypothetical protein
VVIYRNQDEDLRGPGPHFGAVHVQLDLEGVPRGVQYSPL